MIPAFLVYDGTYFKLRVGAFKIWQRCADGTGTGRQDFDGAFCMRGGEVGEKSWKQALSENKNRMTYLIDFAVLLCKWMEKSPHYGMLKIESNMHFQIKEGLVCQRRKIIITIAKAVWKQGADTGKAGGRSGDQFYDKNIPYELRWERYQRELFPSGRREGGQPAFIQDYHQHWHRKRPPSFGSDLISADNLFRFQSEVIGGSCAGGGICIMCCALLDGTGIDSCVPLRGHQGARGCVRERNLHRGQRCPQVSPDRRERRDYNRYYAGRDWGSSRRITTFDQYDTDWCGRAVQLIKDY